jgi:hypothetical protein
MYVSRSRLSCRDHIPRPAALFLVLVLKPTISWSPVGLTIPWKHCGLILIYETTYMTDRHWDRVAVRWPIHYERLFLGHWSEPKEAVCINVGGYGMLLLLNEVVEKDEFLRLHMRDANRDSPFTLAQVRWAKPETFEVNAAMMAGIEYVDTHNLIRLSAASNS